MNYKDRLFLKLTSGRFLITIILTIAFSFLAAKGKLTSEFTNIYMILVTFYFSKDRLSISTSNGTSILQEDKSAPTDSSNTQVVPAVTPSGPGTISEGPQ